MTSAVQRYAELEATYLPGAEGQENTYSCLAAVDFQLRFVTMCAAAALRERDPDKVQLGRSLGFGGYLAFLRNASSLLTGAAGREVGARDRVRDLIHRALAAVQQGNGADPQFGTLEKLRNHLYHGGPVPDGPSGDEQLQRAAAAVSALSGIIRGALEGASAIVAPGEEDLHQLEVRWPEGGLLLWPFICAEPGDAWCVLASFTQRYPEYFRRDSRKVRVAGRGDSLMLALSESLAPRNQDSTLPEFVGALRADLSAFCDPDYVPHHHEADGVVNFIWIRQTGEGLENRSDRFRLGHGDQRQWEASPGVWAPYPDFLRQLANWAVVARAMRQRLARIEAELQSDERRTLGWSKELAPLIPPKVALTDLESSRPDRRNLISFDELRELIDERLAARGSRTRVFFIAGEAGIGKTRTLIATALDRARRVETEGDLPSSERHPLFLYVRSTGQALHSLRTVVQAAAADTLNLTEERVQALCRNGLFAVFIDGFDELLGGVGYDDALGALGEWIEALGGRGVIVVSARSSYYLNQYRSSMSRLANQDLAVEHRVAHIERWTDDQVHQFLRYNQLDPADVELLEPTDRALLRLPFFARVYVESAKAGVARVRSLPDTVVEQYLAREAGKLIMPGDQQRTLLSAEELREVFETLAETMAATHEREASPQDLEFAAQIAIGEEDLETRHGLARRLTVLCGVAVRGTQVDPRFAFQHEFFFDFFLADAVLRHLRKENYETVLQALSQAQWRRATTSRLTQQEPERIRLLLADIDGRFARLGQERRAAFRANVGGLWANLIEQGREIDAAHVCHATFEDLDLESVQVTDTRFEHCEFDTLRMPPTGAWTLALADCTVGTLWVRNSGAPLRGVSEFERVTIGQMLSGNALLERPDKIAEELRSLGVPLPPEPQVASEGELAEASRFFLDRIRRRTDHVYVAEQNYECVDEFAHWTKDYGLDVWATFIRRLDESGVARLDSMAASGRTIRRLKFIVSPDTVLARPTGIPVVDRFWALVA